MEEERARRFSLCRATTTSASLERDPPRAERAIQHSAPDGIRTHAGAGLSRLPLPFGLRGPAIRACVILAARSAQRDASVLGVGDVVSSFIRVSGGSSLKAPVAMRSSITTFASGRKCTGCTPVIRPVALSRK